MNNNIYLNEKLERRQLNLHTLSEESGVAYSTIYNLFTGKKSIRDAKCESLHKIANTLGMSLDSLYNSFVAREEADREIMPDFLLMWENEVTSSVHINKSNVLIERFSKDPVKQIFSSDNISRIRFGEIIRSRCFDEHRTDSQQLLSLLGLKEFNPYEICKITHGKMVQDKIWFKFANEKITYSDLNKEHSCLIK